ncbi:MAG: MBL fold metallo-hydrolase [Oscillospiraceae bacterium]|nr:MBL fold metallo-hydrolase [Oscillospiraceae bacterium]
MDVHARKALARGVTMLYGVENECCMYLIEGSDKALLLDTGLGTTNICDEVSSLTAKPLYVVNTHGHGDHSGGNIYFDTVYMHRMAETDARDAFELNKTVLTEEQCNTVQSNMNSNYEVRYVADGFTFDLGNKSLEVIEIPGHTAGCIALLDKSDNILFCGDSLVSIMDILLVVPQAQNMSTYIGSLKKLQLRVADFSEIYSGHDTVSLPVSFLEDAIECCEKLLQKEIVGEDISLPPVFGISEAKRISYKSVNIEYDLKRL